ncbi:hypothetical protein GOODEAATRI_007637 [Goodea atripinnis]|uniref:small monomeric GTPase n=1 Tax=Goodea atripinnis TaxID=208336 RepID=A0ABV0P289_9TELE
MSHRTRTSPIRAYDFLLKFLLVGDSDVGKGEILESLQDGASESPYGYNLGIDYKTTTILLDGRRVKLQLWYENTVAQLAVVQQPSSQRVICSSKDGCVTGEQRRSWFGPKINSKHVRLL